MADHFGGSIANLLSFETQVDIGVGSAGQIDHRLGKGLVQRCQGRAEPINSSLVAQCFVEGFAQNEWRIAKPLVLLPSARVDSDTTFGTFPTGRLAARLDPSDVVRIRASVGTGFRAPSFREQNLRFANASAGYLIEGNPYLQPERSVQTSASIAAESEDVGSITVSGF